MDVLSIDLKIDNENFSENSHLLLLFQRNFMNDQLHLDIVNSKVDQREFDLSKYDQTISTKFTSEKFNIDLIINSQSIQSIQIFEQKNNDLHQFKKMEYDFFKSIEEFLEDIDHQFSEELVLPNIEQSNSNGNDQSKKEDMDLLEIRSKCSSENVSNDSEGFKSCQTHAVEMESKIGDASMYKKDSMNQKVRRFSGNQIETQTQQSIRNTMDEFFYEVENFEDNEEDPVRTICKFKTYDEFEKLLPSTQLVDSYKDKLMATKLYQKIESDNIQLLYRQETDTYELMDYQINFIVVDIKYGKILLKKGQNNVFFEVSYKQQNQDFRHTIINQFLDVFPYSKIINYIDIDNIQSIEYEHTSQIDKQLVFDRFKYGKNTFQAQIQVNGLHKDKDIKSEDTFTTDDFDNFYRQIEFGHAEFKAFIKSTKDHIISNRPKVQPETTLRFIPVVKNRIGDDDVEVTKFLDFTIRKSKKYFSVNTIKKNSKSSIEKFDSDQMVSYLKKIQKIVSSNATEVCLESIWQTEDTQQERQQQSNHTFVSYVLSFKTLLSSSFISNLELKLSSSHRQIVDGKEVELSINFFEESVFQELKSHPQNLYIYFCLLKDLENVKMFDASLKEF